MEPLPPKLQYPSAVPPSPDFDNFFTGDVFNGRWRSGERRNNLIILQ